MTDYKSIKFPKIKVKVTSTKGDDVFITGPDDLPEMLRAMFNADTIEWTEEFILVCLNRMHKVIGYYKVASGGFSSVIADPKVVITLALQSAASSIIVAHNHPSGNRAPSEGDKDVTRKIKGACDLLDMSLLDHFIITKDGYTSFMELGLI